MDDTAEKSAKTREDSKVTVKTEEIKTDALKGAVPEKKIKTSSKIDYWKIATVVLGILVIVSIFTAGFGIKNITGQAVAEPEKNVITKEDAAKKSIDYINKYLLNGQGTATLLGVKEDGSLYNMEMDISGRKYNSYITKDGGLLFPSSIDLTNTPATPAPEVTEAPKTDKPVAEAFVFSYCPYGLQFEKALSPVYKALKDSADIKIVYIGAMHGEYEKVESYRQLCIQKVYGTDKLWQYLDKFSAETKIGDCGSDEKCSLPLVEKIMVDLGIDKNKINACMKTDAEALYTADNARAAELGVSGSPTFVVNGAKVNVGRSPDAILEGVCSAFNTLPAACGVNLSTTQASPGFGASAGTGASSGAACG